MSGHNKWSKIKRKKGVADNKRGQIFTKLSRAITLAASKGVDPDTNFLLRLAILQAKEVNMPLENIQRAVAKGSGADSSTQIVEMLYEAKIGELSVLINTQTDNINRTVADVRFIVEAKNGGKLVPGGSLSWQFQQKGVIIITPFKYQKSERFGKEDSYIPADIDQVELDLLDLTGVEDIYKFEENEGVFVEVIVARDSISQAIKEIQQLGYKVESTSIDWLPDTKTDLSEAEQEQLTNLLEALEDNADVNQIWHNAN